MMKKILTAVLTAMLAVAVCGCEGKIPNPDADEDNISYVESSQNEEKEVSVISRDKVQTVSAPSDSISFDKACELIDRCSMDELELPQSAKDFRKYYFATVDYYGKPYYSVYFYTETKDTKVFVGTNILVACDGGVILKKKWTGNYEKVQTDTAENEKTLKELYPDAKIAPAEALQALVGKNLKLEYDLSKYVFEFSDGTAEIQGMVCFAVMPKLELSNSIQLSGKLYINTDGSGSVWKADPAEAGEYIELE